MRARERTELGLVSGWSRSLPKGPLPRSKHGRDMLQGRRAAVCRDPPHRPGRTDATAGRPRTRRSGRAGSPATNGGRPPDSRARLTNNSTDANGGCPRCRDAAAATTRRARSTTRGGDRSRIAVTDPRGPRRAAARAAPRQRAGGGGAPNTTPQRAAAQRRARLQRGVPPRLPPLPPPPRRARAPDGRALQAARPRRQRVPADGVDRPLAHRELRAARGGGGGGHVGALRRGDELLLLLVDRHPGRRHGRRRRARRGAARGGVDGAALPVARHAVRVAEPAGGARRSLSPSLDPLSTHHLLLPPTHSPRRASTRTSGLPRARPSTRRARRTPTRSSTTR